MDIKNFIQQIKKKIVSILENRMLPQIKDKNNSSKPKRAYGNNIINKIRMKYIYITGIALFSVMAVLVTSIIIVNMNRNERDLDERLEMIYNNAGMMPDFAQNNPEELRSELDKTEKKTAPSNDYEDEKENFEKKSDESQDENSKKNIDNKNDKDISKIQIIPKDTDMMKRNFSDVSRFGTVKLDKNKNIIDINVDRISTLSEDEMEEYVDKIINQNKGNGWIDNYRYKYANYNNGSMIIILNGAYAKQSNKGVTTTSIAVACVSYLVVMFIIVLFSNRMIKPFEENFNKQKQFITDASHELKTPLTIIMANAEILEMSDEENEWIDGIKNQTIKMKELVNNLVSLSKMYEDEEKCVMQKFELSEALYDTAMVFKGVCETKGMKYVLEIEQDLEMVGDESGIRQLISLLIDNAVKYCDKGGEIDVYLHKKTTRAIEILVTNDYEDIRNVNLDKMFDRFYKEDKSRSQKGSYGLGLSIATMIVEKHGGVIKAKNIDNKKMGIEVLIRK